MKILLVEDEKRMVQALSSLLELEGYETDAFYDGEEGLLALQSEMYDLAVIDVMLPGLSGFEIVRQARQKGVQAPILLLTAKSESEDKVEGLDSGADDYLTKPFDTNELLARIRALTRRNRLVNNCLISFGDLSLNTKTFQLSNTHSSLSVRLKDKEYRIMEYLMLNQNRIIEREQFASKIWGYENDAEYNNVEVYLTFTRKKLAFIESRVKIKSVRGIGYELKYETF